MQITYIRSRCKSWIRVRDSNVWESSLLWAHSFQLRIFSTQVRKVGILHQAWRWGLMLILMLQVYRILRIFCRLKYWGGILVLDFDWRGLFEYSNYGQERITPVEFVGDSGLSQYFFGRQIPSGFQTSEQGRRGRVQNIRRWGAS